MFLYIRSFWLKLKPIYTVCHIRCQKIEPLSMKWETSKWVALSILSELYKTFLITNAINLLNIAHRDLWLYTRIPLGKSSGQMFNIDPNTFRLGPGVGQCSESHNSQCKKKELVKAKSLSLAMIWQKKMTNLVCLQVYPLQVHGR